MAVERRECGRCDEFIAGLDGRDDESSGELHGGCREQFRFCYEFRGYTDGVGASIHHDATGESNGDCGRQCDFQRNGDRDGAVQLSMALEWGERRRRNQRNLELDGSDNQPSRQLRCLGQQLGRIGDEQSGDIDGEPGVGVTHDHDATGESVRDGGWQCNFQRDGDGHGAAELSMAVERSERGRRNQREFESDRRGYQSSGELHGGCREQFGLRDQLRGDTNSAAASYDHNATSGSNGDSRRQCGFQRDSDRDRAIELSMALERGECDRRDQFIAGLDGRDDESSGELHGGCREQFRFRYEFCGYADGAGAANHHNATRESVSDGGWQCDIQRDGDGDRAVELSVAVERGECDRRDQFIAGLDGRDDESSGKLHGGRREQFRFRYEFCGYADGNCHRSGAHDHDATRESVSDGGRQCNFQRNSDRDRAVELSVAVERSECGRRDKFIADFDGRNDESGGQLRGLGE